VVAVESRAIRKLTSELPTALRGPRIFVLRYLPEIFVHNVEIKPFASAPPIPGLKP
jgi:hypothetical protein